MTPFMRSPLPGAISPMVLTGYTVFVRGSTPTRRPSTRAGRIKVKAWSARHSVGLHMPATPLLYGGIAFTKRKPMSRVNRRVTFQLSCTNHSYALYTLDVFRIMLACDAELKTPRSALAYV